jgi:glycosyltransferase involved in cell wall biosynthesis
MTTQISVIIPTYNRASVVQRAIESALAAVARDDEIIVVDDGSTDGTSELLAPLQDRIRYVRTVNLGPSAARNLGIQLATSPLVAFLDSDDEWLPDKLYLQRAVMSNFPDLVFCFTDLQANHASGMLVHGIVKLWNHDVRVGSSHASGNWDELLAPGMLFSDFAALPPDRADFRVHIGNIYPALMDAYYVWTCSILVRKDLAGKALHFPEDQRVCEEWECFARVARNGPVAFLNCETAVQHLHDLGRLTDISEATHVQARIRMLERTWGADTSFLARHLERYQAALRTQHLRRVKCLIKDGQLSAAKRALRSVKGGTLPYRLLTMVPPSIFRRLLSARRRILTRTAA